MPKIRAKIDWETVEHHLRDFVDGYPAVDVWVENRLRRVRGYRVFELWYWKGEWRQIVWFVALDGTMEFKGDNAMGGKQSSPPSPSRFTLT